ncbi:hypothetical protein HU230_0042390 (plasmid) [Bradyrhizobium quebecense]|uniref:Uncharacterized protein n=1 Tax=Bradyrhizobium quebecense TaxID=2748629 RepID=A0A973WVM8_9BRAD|nr:hypothetical protein [Bradyrhizobium quebecense]UGA48996.1 hypothetical protein HU230_0042390 [Bradyrhizobium quebecense]
MADDENMSEVVNVVNHPDDSAKRLEALRLSAARRTSAARLPSNDDLLIAVEDTKLAANGIKTVPLNSEDSEDRSKRKNVHTFFTGADFQALAKLGNKTAKQMDEELIYIKYEGNYYTKNGLWNAIKVPDGHKTTTEYKNSEFRKITVALGLTAERDNDLFQAGETKRRDKDGKIVLKDGKPEIVPFFKLDGEAQLYKTPAGNRRRAVAHKNPHTSGEQAPDIMLRMKNGVMKGFSRLPDDQYSGCTAWELEADLDGDIWLKSKFHGYQTIDFIERTLGPNQATHRLRDYVGETRGYNQDTHTAYVKIDTAYFPIKEVVELLPNDAAAQAVQGPPSIEAMDHRIIMRMPEGNTFVTPDFLGDPKRFPEYFQEVCKEHGINPQWGTFKPNWDKMLDKYASHDRVLVEVDGTLVEGHSIELPKGKSITDMYDSGKIFYADDGKARGVSYTKPSFTSLAQTLQRAEQEKNKGKTLDIPTSVTERLLALQGGESGSSNTSAPQRPPSSRYEDRNERLRDTSRSC